MSTQSNEIGKLAEALAKAQAELTGAVKDSTNPFFKSKYADLESVWIACRGPLSRAGLSVSQTTSYLPDAGICVVTTLLHISGQWIQGVLPIMPIKNDPQAVGSAITYARRYALAAIVGVVQVDDDGEGAHGRAAALSPPHPIQASSGPSPIIAHPKVARPREETSAILRTLYPAYLKKFPQTVFSDLLQTRYAVTETKLMTVEQIEDLIRLMEKGLKPGL